MAPSGRNKGAISLGVLLLAYRLLATGFEHIPPVTLLLTMLQAGLYMGFINPPWTGQQVCLSAYDVLVRNDYRRLLLAAVEHADDMHLYYNMSSFLMKGRSLESRFGSRKFFILLAVLTLGTGACYVGLQEAAARHINPQQRLECAIGFSGVLFALKVLTTHYDSRGSSSSRSSSRFLYFNINFPTRYAVWIELLIIHILVPRSSFVGHLAGILVGLAYVSGPLEVVVDALDSILGGVLSIFGFSSEPSNRRRGRRRPSGSGRRGGWFGGPTYTYAHGTAAEDHYDGGPPLSTYYSQPEDHYRPYSREHFNPARDFPSERPPVPRRSDIGWNVSPSYTYARGSVNPSAPELVEDSPLLTSEELRQRRLRRFD